MRMMLLIRRRTTNVGALSSRRASLTSHLLRGSSLLVLYRAKPHAAPHGRLPRLFAFVVFLADRCGVSGMVVFSFFWESQELKGIFFPARGARGKGGSPGLRGRIFFEVL